VVRPPPPALASSQGRETHGRAKNQGFRGKSLTIVALVFALELAWLADD
jgi:hypothetical protein